MDVNVARRDLNVQISAAAMTLKMMEALIMMLMTTIMSYLMFIMLMMIMIYEDDDDDLEEEDEGDLQDTFYPYQGVVKTLHLAEFT